VSTFSPGRSLRTALSLFTVFPAARPAQLHLERAEAARAVLWMPFVGALVGVVAAAVLASTDRLVDGPMGTLLASTLAVVVLAMMTGGLHLDGLADTVDGLGSRLSAPEALAVMRQPDIGPLGVAAVLLVLLVQVSALAAASTTGAGAAAVVLAAVTSRTAVILAAGHQVPSAHPQGFGALVAGTVNPRAQAASLASLVLAVGLVTVIFAGPAAAVPFLAAVVVGLFVADQVRRTAQRRLGGMTGDVFGAMIELTTAAVLLAVALIS
jgi:adenosylcobinamide-GDP ribazoletransferase